MPEYSSPYSKQIQLSATSTTKHTSRFVIIALACTSRMLYMYPVKGSKKLVYPFPCVVYSKKGRKDEEESGTHGDENCSNISGTTDINVLFTYRFGPAKEC